MPDPSRAAGVRTDLTAAPARLGTLLGPARAAAVRVAPGAGFLLIIGLWVHAYLGWIFLRVPEFRGQEGDGPFQLFNPLRRIAAGQTGGIDFQYFHGLGFPYLHYPLFQLFGGDQFACDLSRELIALGLYLVATLAVFGAATRRLTSTLGLTAVALIVCDQVGMVDVTFAINASLGVRSVMPVFAAAILLARLRPKVEAVAVGVAIGLGLLLGVEYGVSGAIMLGLVWLGRRLTGCPGGSLAWAGGVAAVAAATASGLLVAIGGPTGAAAALRFSFVEMPQDQFWYFGAPPNPFIYSWATLISDRPLHTRVVAPALVLAYFLVRRARRCPADRPSMVVLLGFLGGAVCALVSYLGYCSQHYYEPFLRVVILASLVVAWKGWNDRPAGDAVRVRVRQVLIAGIVLFAVAGPAYHYPSSLLDVPKNTRDIAIGVRTFREGRCKLDVPQQARLDAVVTAIDGDRAANGVTRPPVIWSTYAGRVEDHYGVFNPYCDYMIHALGQTRRAEYAAAFGRSKPDYAVTMRIKGWSYEEWMRHGAWDFYEQLLLNYDVLATTEQIAIWKRRPGEWKEPDLAAGRVTREPESPVYFTAPAPPGTPADAARIVEVEYEMRNPLAGVPLVGNLPRYLIGGAGCEQRTPISLPPYRRSWSFLVLPVPGQTPSFYTQTFSLVGGGVTITKVHVRPIALAPEQIEVMKK